MKCLYPISFKDKNGRGWQIPCSKCRNCMINEVTDWSERLQIEHDASYNALFITLTYREDTAELSKSEIRAFIKRLRNYYSYRMKEIEQHEIIENRPLRMFLVGEYGYAGNRPHYHLILFNIPVLNKKNFKIEALNQITEIWGLGMVHVGNVTKQSINYCAKYIFKSYNINDKQKPFRVISNGIGKQYADRMKDYHNTNEVNYITKQGGIKKRIPKYLRHKLFDEDTRIRINELTNCSLNDEHIKHYKDIEHQKLIEELAKEKENQHNFNMKINEKQTI